MSLYLAENEQYYTWVNNQPASHPRLVEGENGAVVAYALEVSVDAATKKQARQISKDNTPMAIRGCTACNNRAEKFVGYVGANGPMFFEQVDQGSAVDSVYRLKALAEKVCAPRPGLTYELRIVTSGTFPEVNEGVRENGEPYQHWTILPTNVTSPEMAQRIQNLRAIWTSMDGRLSKLLAGPEARASVRIMEEVRTGLQRPDHWGRVLRWVMNIQNRFTKNWDDMSEVERWDVRIFAMATGAVDGSAHKDFYQASNIVDFLEMPSKEALATEMDTRSDPDYYQVSQLNRRLVSAGVTSDRIIGLSWEGKYTDDLDIHVQGPTDREIYYGNKRTHDGQLDFDANVSRGEAEPCENVSCFNNGPYRVLVNNYTRRTHGKAIPFTIVIREKGVPDVVIQAEWPQNRHKGNLLQITKHTFGQSGSTAATNDIQMSAKSAGRIRANEAHWDEHIGNVFAQVATVADLEQTGCQVVTCGINDSTILPPVVSAEEASAKATSGLMSMVKSAVSSVVTGASKKSYLSENVLQNPTTVSELFGLLEKDAGNGKTHRVSIELRDHSPGYMVDIRTKTEGVRKSSVPAMCHYRNKFELPSKPDKVGNARMDRSWLTNSVPRSKVTISHLAKVQGKYFLVVQGGKLPIRHDDFPLAGGFYPTDLASDFHVHRERWAYYHSQLKPTMKVGVDALSAPAIGTFLVGEKAVIYLDGTKLTLQV